MTWTLRGRWRSSWGTPGTRPGVESDGPGALLAADQWAPELVVLDLGLPTMDGIEVCRRLRSGSTIPILVLTARGEVKDRVRGLDAGADDYVTKPFSLEEVIARIRSTLRRARMREQGDRLEFAGLVLDSRARTVSYEDRAVELTQREFDLLELFMRHPGQALSRATILCARVRTSRFERPPRRHRVRGGAASECALVACDPAQRAPRWRTGGCAASGRPRAAARPPGDPTNQADRPDRRDDPLGRKAICADQLPRAR